MEDIVVSLFICLIIPIGMSLLVLKDRSRVLMIFFLSGLFMCLFAGQINGLILATTKLDQFTLSITITPVVEEILKSIPILVFAFIIKPQRQFIMECALMVGIGFSVLENGYILFTNAEDITLLWALHRGFGAAMLHAATSFIVGYGISFFSLRKKTFVTGTYAMLLLAMVIHAIYNMFVQSSNLVYCGIILPSVLFIPLVIYISKR